MARVFGFIHTETGGPALGATVRAFDKDLRHEQLLGEAVITETSGRYEIPYTADQFRRAEKRTADLIVRAFDREGNLRAESEIRFNAGDEERIDLTFEPLPIIETPRLSELERLQESIEPVREGVAYRDFTDQDLTFLTEETIRAGSLGVSERRTVRERLGFLRLADKFALQMDIPLAAFYGWFRQDQPQELDELLDVPIRTLLAALEAAIRGNIIPDITAGLAEILERVGSLRFEQGRLVNHRFVVQLIDAETNRPLTGYSVEVSDPAAEPEDQQLGTLFTDGRGACVIMFSLPGDAPANARRQLQLRISDEGVEVAEATIDARANQEEVATLRVRLRETESGNVPIENFAPPALAARLRERGIRTLHDVLAHPEVMDEDDPEGLERLRATAKFAVLATGLGTAGRDHLLNHGYRSLLDVGATSRAEFVRDHREGLGGDAATYATHFAARETGKVLHHMIGSAWIKQVTKPGDEPDDPDIPTGVNEVLSGFAKCGCKDCDSAVSPAAYLAHLLEWTLEHIKDGTASISFSQLEEEFHQPFGDLPASCAAVEDQVRQVRICVETLWRFTGFLDRADLQLPTPFRTAYRHLRNQLYRAILTHLGTSFEQLRKATLQVQGDNLTAELVAAQRRTVADLLGIDETHLNALFFNVDQPPISPSEDELQQRFGFKSTRAEDVFASTGIPDLVRWQQERLESLWQQQDWPTDAYSGEARLPFVDPALIDESYLRAPLTENAAFALLDARREALAAHRQTLVDQAPQQNGLVDLLEGELGQSIEQLRSLYATLQAGEQPDEITHAHETIGALHLSPAGFTHLMGIDARLEAGEPIGATPEEIEAAWESVFDILSRAHRRGVFPAWVEEENDLDLIFGPKLFWLPVEPSAPVNPWQAAPTERAEWQEALGRRSARPVIDPDQIPANYVIVIMVFASAANQGDELGLVAAPPSLDAMGLWQRRREWIDDRLKALGAARENQPTRLATLEAALGASRAGIGLDTLSELATQDAEGRDLAPRLAQLNLTTAEYRFLAEIRELAQGNATVSSDMWEAVDAVLVEDEKRREFAEWRLDEQAAEITLHPHRFVVQKDDKPADDSPQLRWLHDPIALQQWVTTLEARADQLRALREGLNRAVSDAEEAVLPLLRNILIMQTVADGDSLLEKAESLDKRLLIDMRMDGCQMTTRVSQAIETLQRFIRGVYTQEHPPLMQHLTLDAEEDYDAEWPVLGSYATWRAFMLAYLFPENLLHVSPPSKMSYGFTTLKKELPSHITPAQACEHAKKYSSYFQDICGLDVQATCQIETVQLTNDECEPTSTSTSHLMHLFAHARESGYVYWAYFDAALEFADTISTWTPLKQLGQVDRILGATPHLTPSGRRFILLFAATAQSLLLRKFDVDNNEWLGVKKLDWPPGYEKGIASGAVIQKRQRVGAPLPINTFEDFKFPTFVAVSITNDVSFIRKLRPDAEGWDTEDWFPLYGPALSEKVDEVKGLKVDGIKALVQIADKKSYLIFADLNSQLHYRTAELDDSRILHEDDFKWKRVAQAPSFSPHRGAFVSPGQLAVFCFYRTAQYTRYRRIDVALQPVSLDNSDFSYTDIVDFNNNWLIPNIGISLDDTRLYVFDRYVPDFFIPAHEPDPGNDPPHPAEWHPLERKVNGIDIPLAHGQWWGDPHFSGSLLGLIIRTLDDFKEKFFFDPPENAEFYDDTADDMYFYLIQQKYYGVEKFLKDIEGIEGTSYFDPTLGWWKYANDRIAELSQGSWTLATVIQQLLVNQLKDEKEKWAPKNTKKDDIIFGQRPTDPISSLVNISSDDWTVPPHSGEESVGGATRVTVLQQDRGTPGQSLSVPVRTTTRIDGTELSGGPELSATAQYELAPFGSGPFDILPERSIPALQKRKEDLKLLFSPLKGAPLSVKSYLHEAFFLVPITIAQALKQAGHFEDALVWYRLVFDYLGPESHRKIYPGLEEEEKLSLNYAHAEDFLNDASNAHAIAATRKNTHTRHVLLLVIRCLIDNADALFSRDTTTDNARARELYSRALRLLALKELKLGSSACANIIGQLEIDVVEPGILPLQQFKVALAHIPDPDRLSSVVTALKAISRDTSRPAIDRLAAMRDNVLTAVNEIPAPPPMTAVLATKRQAVATLENQFLADQASRMLLTKTHQHTRQGTLARLSKVTDRSEEALLEATTQLPWLRLARQEERNDAPDERLDLALFSPNGSGRLAVLSQIKSALPMASLTATRSGSFAIGTGISFDFCIPRNPVIQALRTRAENNLIKLRTCRNIAGFLRQIDPYGAPIGIGSGMVSPDGSIFSGIVDAPATPYRYMALINRAKELVGISQQIEAGYQAALENAEHAALTLMQAEQSVELAGARVSLQDLRVIQANSELSLAQLQKSSAVLREGTYSDWIDAGMSEYENLTLKAYQDAGEAQQAAAKANAVGAVASAAIAGMPQGGDIVTLVSNGIRAALSSVVGAAAIAEGVFNVQAIQAQTSAQVNSTLASFERRGQEWQLQQGLAALDVQIGDQQIVLAQNQINIVQQELIIAGIEKAHAVDVLNFLLSKNFTEEMYRWIAGVLEDVYRFFLQEATVISRLAERQLAFERQEGPLKVIQSDYWNVAAGPAASGSTGDNVGRLGLTGSARLLKDIYQLDSYAFETRQRKQALTLTLDLAAMFPLEFQRFRETGVLIFETPQSLIDRQMPGYYLCLIQQVSLSVVALIPPTYGIRATLTSAGISRVVVGGDTFQTVTIRNLPERMALTSATTTSGPIALEPDSQSLLNPFEGSGVDMDWELRMPKAANPFDYNSMATVLFTVNMTALHSFDYEREVIQRLDRKVSFDRAFDFRQVFPDPWYDLNNPDQTETPMVVRFNTRRSDFPPNLSNLAIQHVVLYLVRKDGEVFEQPIRHLHFTAEGMNGSVGGPASTVNGRVSTRSGNGANWLPFIGQPPYGEWELAFPDNPPGDAEARNRFANESIETILLVMSISGQMPAFPY